jgi:hypothetical protein
MTDPFERVGRMNKTTKLVRALDAHLETAGIDPRMPGLADALAVWTPEQWARLAVVNGIRKPSPITVLAVLDCYRERNEPVLALPPARSA